MRGLIPLLFLVSNVFSLVSADDKFIFNVTFTCGYHSREKYDYNIQFFEYDFLSSDEAITSQKIGEARPGLAHFVMEGWQTSDGLFDSEYEVYMVLHHDCTEHDSEKTITLNLLPKCEVGRGLCRYTIKKDLMDLSGEDDYHAHLEYE